MIVVGEGGGPTLNPKQSANSPIPLPFKAKKQSQTNLTVRPKMLLFVWLLFSIPRSVIHNSYTINFITYARIIEVCYLNLRAILKHVHLLYS